MTLHPGHGDTNPSSIAHYLVEPVHALALLILAVAAVLAVWAVARYVDR